MRIVISGEVDVAAGARDEALKGAHALIQAALAEPGCIHYAWTADLSRPGRIHVFAEWESEREETRRLRERLNDIAAGVTRLGEPRSPEPDGAVEAIPPAPESDTPAPAAALPAEPPAEVPNTLAERIRALQHAGARH